MEYLKADGLIILILSVLMVLLRIVKIKAAMT